MSEGDIILTQFHAGIIMDWFSHPQEGLHVRCQKLDFAPRRSIEHFVGTWPTIKERLLNKMFLSFCLCIHECQQGIRKVWVDHVESDRRTGVVEAVHG